MALPSSMRSSRSEGATGPSAGTSPSATVPQRPMRPPQLGVPHLTVAVLCYIPPARVQYEFNESDFEVSRNHLRMYLDESDTIPWKAIRYMAGNVCGRSSSYPKSPTLHYLRSMSTLPPFPAPRLLPLLTPFSGKLRRPRDGRLGPAPAACSAWAFLL